MRTTPTDADTKFKKGQKSGPGRPKGTPNKVTKELKEMVLQALDQAGGIDYLIACAHDEKTKTAFLSLIGKVLPMTVQGKLEHAGGITVNIKQF